jgi:hypothetical protein
VYNTYLNRFIAMPVFGRWGFAIDQSNGSDLLQWNPYPSTGMLTVYPPVTYGDDPLVDMGYGRTAASRQYYNYASLISPDGDSNSTGQVFYLYYMKLFPGDDFDQRYAMRRKVTLMLSRSSPCKLGNPRSYPCA